MYISALLHQLGDRHSEFLTSAKFNNRDLTEMEHYGDGMLLRALLLLASNI